MTTVGTFKNESLSSVVVDVNAMKMMMAMMKANACLNRAHYGHALAIVGPKGQRLRLQNDATLAKVCSI